MKARSFFYVCGGLLFLSIAWHLGARSAQAQAPAMIEGPSSGAYATGVVGRTLYYKFTQSADPAGTVPEPVPGGRVIASSGSPTLFNVLLENGDVYWINTNDTIGWVYYGNLTNHPTPATKESWGGLKERYR